MDEAHYCAEAFSPITGRCLQVVNRQDGQAAGRLSRYPSRTLAAVLGHLHPASAGLRAAAGR
jgi:hypothetical protein